MNEIQIRETLSDRFGESGYQLNYTSNKVFILILLYPEIVITNNVNEFHTIKDLYIKLRRNGSDYISFEGLRGTLTQEELGIGYSHSHIQTGLKTQFSGFCLGSSEIISFLHEDILKSKEEFEYFLEVLKSYLSWESIEGVPYIRINTISGYSKLDDITFSNNYYIINELMSSLRLDKVKVNLNFKVKSFEELEKFISPYIEEQEPYYMVNKIGNKYYGKNKIDVPLEMPFLLNFNGKDVYLKVENVKKDERVIQKTPHPNFTKAVCGRIQQEIFRNYLGNCRVGTKIPINNRAESLGSS